MESNMFNSTPPPATPPPPKETVREVHHHHYEKRGGFWRLVVGLFVIFVGLSLLAQNTGWLGSIDVWGIVSRLWPLFIIIGGLSLLSRGGWVGGAITIIAVIVIVGLVFAAFVTVPAGEVKTQNFDISKGQGVKVAEVTLNHGAGGVHVQGGSASLVSGNLESTFATLETSSQVDGEIQYIDLEMDSNFRGIYRKNPNELTVNLSNDVPIRLNIDSGASDLRIDLSSVNVTDFNLDTGASSLDLILGDKATSSRVAVDAGASSINITIPRTLGAKLVVDGGLSSRNFQDFRSVGEGKYESENYASAQKKVEINIDAGVSSLNIGWK